MRRAIAIVLIGCFTASAVDAEMPVPPEPPAPIPNATTLPSVRNRSLGPEPPAATPGETTLPSARNRSLGPEAPASIPPAATLPKTYDPAAIAAPEMPKSGGPIVVPNGNGTSTIIEPDGTVRTVPTPR